MPTIKIAYTGPSWEEVVLSFGKQNLYVIFRPARGARKKVDLLLQITLVSDFRSGSTFRVVGMDLQGKRHELTGHCPHRPSEAADYEVVS